MDTNSIDEEDLDPPPQVTIEEIKASLERSRADIAQGRTVEGHVVLDRLRVMIDEMKERRRAEHGPADR